MNLNHMGKKEGGFGWCFSDLFSGAEGLNNSMRKQNSYNLIVTTGNRLASCGLAENRTRISCFGDTRVTFTLLAL